MPPKRKKVVSSSESSSEESSSEDERPQRKTPAKQPVKKPQQGSKPAAQKASNKPSQQAQKGKQPPGKSQSKTPPPKKQKKDASSSSESSSEEESSSDDNKKSLAKKGPQAASKVQKSPVRGRSRSPPPVTFDEDRPHKGVPIQSLFQQFKAKRERLEKEKEQLRTRLVRVQRENDELNANMQLQESKMKKIQDDFQFQKRLADSLQQLNDDRKNKIEQLEHFELQYKKQNETIRSLKAQNVIDLMNFSVQVVSDHPDLVQENALLHEQLTEMKFDLESYKKAENQQINELTEKTSQLNKAMQRLDILQQEHSDMSKELIQLQESENKVARQKEGDIKTISVLQADLKDRNADLAGRLETISQLIHDNERLTKTLRAQKTKLEVFKLEKIAQFDKELLEKKSEIEVLKEMVKSSQVQIKTKEIEMSRQKQKLLYLEGSEIAQRFKESVNGTHDEYRLNASGRKLASLKKTYKRNPKALTASMKDENSLKSLNLENIHSPKNNNYTSLHTVDDRKHNQSLVEPNTGDQFMSPERNNPLEQNLFVSETSAATTIVTSSNQKKSLAQSSNSKLSNKKRSVGPQSKKQLTNIQEVNDL